MRQHVAPDHLPESAWRHGAGVLDAERFDAAMMAAARDGAMRAPAAIACIEPGRIITAGAIWHAIELRASAIPADLTGPIGVVLPSGIEQAASALACLVAGRIYVPFDPAAPLQRNAELFRAVGVGAAFGPPELLPEGCRVITPGTSGLAPVSVLPDAPVAITTTSGSSGEPKLVVDSQRSMAFSVLGIIDAYRLAAGDVIVSTGPPNSVAALVLLTSALISGSALLTCDVRTHGLKRLLDMMHLHRATFFRSTPTLLRSILRHPAAREAFASVRVVRLIGEPVTGADVAALRRLLPDHAAVFSCYGSTEAVGFEGELPPDLPDDAALVPSGRMRAGASFVILDEAGQPCPDGVSGEIVVRSRYNALGEWRDGACVPGRMLPDPSDPASRIYRTGDFAYVLPDGAVMVQGRLDRQIKVNGNRVGLDEVEAALRGLPGVANAAVLARRNDTGMDIAAFVVTAEPVEQLRAALLARLPRFMVPARFVAVDQLPQLPSGKVDLQRLSRMPA